MQTPFLHALLILGTGAFLLAGCSKEADKTASSPPTSRPVTTMAAGQTVCPVSNYDVDPTVFVEYQGKRVYLCCDGCKETFLKYPAQFLTKLPQFGGHEEKSLGKMTK